MTFFCQIESPSVSIADLPTALNRYPCKLVKTLELLGSLKISYMYHQLFKYSFEIRRYLKIAFQQSAQYISQQLRYLRIDLDHQYAG